MHAPGCFACSALLAVRRLAFGKVLLHLMRSCLDSTGKPLQQPAACWLTRRWCLPADSSLTASS